MLSSISEDCLIFYGISPDFTKSRQIYNALSDFIKEKHTIDPYGRFNLLIFLQDTPNYLDNFTFNIDLILDNLKALSKNIVKANTAVGILISIHLIIQNFKHVSEKLFRLLIFLDEGSYKIPSNLIDVIKNLINKAKNLPFYIDIVGVEINNKQESDYLKKIANLGNGEFYEVNNIKDLRPLLNELSKKKFIEESLFSRYKLQLAQKETQPFYINLADDPKVIHDRTTCSICFQKDLEGIMMCPSCNTLAHKTCWAVWAKSSVPQIPHVFRCHNCFKLLKLDSDFVFDVQIGRIPIMNEFIQVKRKNNLDYLRELETKNQPKLIQAEDPMVTDIRNIIESKKANSETKEDGTFISFDICPVCNNLLMGDKKSCPICGFKL
ncbi:MAG: hypothetical protein ACFE94_08200 [Candidatus Hodarchaeota archaeon]